MGVATGGACKLMGCEWRPSHETKGRRMITPACYAARKCTLVCAVRSIGANARGIARMHHLERLRCQLMRRWSEPLSHAGDQHLLHDAHGGRPHARKYGDTNAILGYNAHDDTYQRYLEYHLDRRRAE